MDTNVVNLDDTPNSRRTQILEAATQLFYRNGYSGTRMSDIAEAINVTKPIVYRYFQSKEALFSAWVDAVLVVRCEEIVGRIKGSPLNVRDTSYALLERAVEKLQTPDFLTPWRIAFIESDDYPQITKEVYEKFKLPIFLAIAEMFEKGIENGELKSKDAQLLARLFCSPIVAAAALLSTYGKGVLLLDDVEKLLKSHHSAFFDAWGN